MHQLLSKRRPLQLYRLSSRIHRPASLWMVIHPRAFLPRPVFCCAALHYSRLIQFQRSTYMLALPKALFSGRPRLCNVEIVLFPGSCSSLAKLGAGRSLEPDMFEQVLLSTPLCCTSTDSSRRALCHQHISKQCTPLVCGCGGKNCVPRPCNMVAGPPSSPTPPVVFIACHDLAECSVRQRRLCTSPYKKN